MTAPNAKSDPDREWCETMAASWHGTVTDEYAPRKLHSERWARIAARLEPPPITAERVRQICNVIDENYEAESRDLNSLRQWLARVHGGAP